MNGLRSLAFGDLIRRLLQFDVLLVSKHALVVDELELALRGAALTQLRLRDFATLNEFILNMEALCAPVVSLLHLWNSIAHTDNDSFKADQSVDILRVELANLVALAHVERPHLNDLIVLLRRMLAESGLNVQSEVLEDLESNQIEYGNDVRRILDHLAVDLGVELFEVKAVDLQIVLVGLRDVA